VEYKQFFLQAFERKPGKWRARVKRSDGQALMIGPDRAKIDQFVARPDALTPEDALLKAIAAIDAGAFSRPGEPSANTETPGAGIGLTRA
jgi:hypothetical protein